MSRAISALQDELRSVREDRDRQIAMLQDEHGRLVAVLEARADRAEAALSGERTRADVLRDRVDALTAELRQAYEAASELRQAEAERQARGLLARLRAALRGG
jgi:hypothetical protein